MKRRAAPCATVAATHRGNEARAARAAGRSRADTSRHRFAHSLTRSLAHSLTRSLAHSLTRSAPRHAAPHRNRNGDGNDDRTPPPAGSARAARRADSRANRTRSRAHARRAGEIRRSRGPRRNGRRPRERRPNARSTHRPSAVDLGQSAPAGRSID
ncbi:quinone oxidoreductase [Burkholderia pseudomallei]|uniref:quinone oxidoreductase n=1 Tax=Burkholderia pseudomallei TaxID=28450 RepID=UPI000A1A0F62|nr:quinone oxidoreductase [Burkholderia pseudomallei]